MKRLLLLTIVFSISLLSHGYNIPEMNVTWLNDDNTFVTTSPKAVAYQFPGRVEFYSWRADKGNKERTRVIINYDSYKQKKIKNPTTFLVRGYANRNAQLHYDTYVVDIKGIMYLLPANHVADNTNIDQINKELSDTFTSYTEELETYSLQYDKIRYAQLSKCRDQYDYYTHLKEVLPARIDSVEVHAKIEYNRVLQEEFDQWYNKQPTSTKNAYKKIAIKRASMGAANSVGGHDYYFSYINNSNKPIKYLYWTGTFYNEVNDIVYCEIRDYSSYTGKDTGPVAPGETGGGVWDCVIYNWSADYVKFSNISITYMDGTSATIGAGDISRLLKSPINETSSNESLRNQLGDEWQYVRNAVAPYESQQSNCNREIETWKNRLYYLENESYGTASILETEEYVEIFKKLNNYYGAKRETIRVLEDFKKKNFLTTK